MKISIITSCYNREATIRDSIESVLSQDYPNIEYIVVDGASNDNSLSVINEYQERISTIISEPDSGMYEAINKGLRLATGDVIGLLHSDDTLFSTSVISDIAEAMLDSGADILYGNGIFVDAKEPHKVVRNWISGKYKKHNMRSGWLPLHPTVYIRKVCFDHMGIYNESYKIAADSDLLVRFLYNGDFSVTYFNNYIIRMKMGGLSTDPNWIKQKWSEDIKLYRSHGFNPYWALACKVLSKVPQFIEAKFMKQ